MSKFEKYEQNHLDILKNPKLAESMGKAKRKYRRRRSMIIQRILVAVSVILLVVGITLATNLDYHKSVPYIVLTCGIMAEGLFYILLKIASKELQDTTHLFWYNNRTKSYRFMCGAIFRNSHRWQSIVYCFFAWFGFICTLIRFNGIGSPMNSIEVLLATVLMMALTFMSFYNICMAGAVDEQYAKFIRLK